MIELNIPLKDFVFDIQKPVDINSLSSEEAGALVKNSYSFMPNPVEVEIAGDVARIRIHDDPQPTLEAKRLYQRAIKHAEQGKYKRAIDVLNEVVRHSPAYVDARRNLGMAYLESGNIAQAEKHLIYALRVDPGDAWSYLLLGNLCVKQKNDLQTAKKLYDKAKALNPDDPVLLANFGVVYAKMDRVEEARQCFKRAIELKPRACCPNLLVDH